jgi:hypothetical protein
MTSNIKNPEIARKPLEKSPLPWPVSRAVTPHQYWRCIGNTSPINRDQLPLGLSQAWNNVCRATNSDVMPPLAVGVIGVLDSTLAQRVVRDPSGFTPDRLVTKYSTCLGLKLVFEIMKL